MSRDDKTPVVSPYRLAMPLLRSRVGFAATMMLARAINLMTICGLMMSYRTVLFKHGFYIKFRDIP